MDHYAEARRLAALLREEGLRENGDAVEEAIEGGFTATEILVALRHRLYRGRAKQRPPGSTLSSERFRNCWPSSIPLYFGVDAGTGDNSPLPQLPSPKDNGLERRTPDADHRRFLDRRWTQ